MLLAALLSLARLIAPAIAMPAPDPIEQIVLQSLCHGEPADQRDPAPARHDCLLCPACHLVAQLAIPAPAGPALRIPTHGLIAPAAPPPDSTGPPSRKRGVPPPTGPPAPFV